MSGLLQHLPKPETSQQGWPWNCEVHQEDYASQTIWPKISIVIPSYNQGRFIEETIRSILLQNYPATEIIIIDGGSTDETLSIIKRYRSWISILVSEKDRGQSHAINKGIDMIGGDVACWINSDDFYTQGTFLKVGSFFRDHPEAALLTGNCDMLYPGVKTELFTAVPFDPFDFISRISIHQPSTFWRAGIHAQIGKIDESLHMCMDYDLWMRIVFNYEVSTLNESLAVFRRYPEAKSSNFEDQTKVYFEYRRVVCRFFTTAYPDAIPILREMGLFENEAMVAYPVMRAFDETTLDRMLNVYLQTCTIQEYNLGHVKRVNELLLRNFSRYRFRTALTYLLKNNFGIRKIFHPYRKF